MGYLDFVCIITTVWLSFSRMMKAVEFTQALWAKYRNKENTVEDADTYM